jgi:benzoylformate decarboxylase
MNVAAALMEILRSAGVRYLFGNPGTTELSFLDALPGSGLEYVVGLQEATAVAAADGYAQASGRIGVVNLHVLPGVANGLAIVHNAARAKTPLLVTAGQQDTRILLEEPILSGDMVRLTESLTKWSYEVRRPEDAPTALRRALTLARTAPTGPVFLSLPMDLATVSLDSPPAPAPPVPAPARADAAALARAADLLVAARSPVVVAGDGVGRAAGVQALVDLAETLGAPVHGEPLHRRANFPGDHALWRGGLVPTPAGARKSLASADVVLLVGAHVFTWLFHAPGPVFAAGQQTIQLDDDAREIGKSHPVTLGIVGEVAAALAELGRLCAARLDGPGRAAAAERARRTGEARAAYAARVRHAAEADATRVPVSAAFLMHTLAGLVPDDVVIVDESASSLPAVLRHLPFRRPGSFFGSRTGTLGWGMGAAVGVQLACPDRKVVATIGDGSLMYAPQALWTAAHYRLPITFVIANNASYAILKSGLVTLGLAPGGRARVPGLDLVDPEIDHVGLARALGVRAARIEKPAALRDALADALHHAGPALVDVAIERDLAGGG